MRLLGSGLKSHFRPLPFATIVVVLLIGAVGVLSVGGVALRGTLDAFALFVTTPLVLILPIATTLIGNLPLAGELSHRFSTQLSFRASRRAYVATRIALAAGASFLALFGSVLVSAWFGFVWTPSETGAIMPEVYYLTPEEAAAQAVESSTFTQLLSLGTAPFVVLYAAWVGLGSALLACLGQWALLRIEQRFVALALPFVVYTVMTIAATVAGSPRFALAYALFPFGLTQAPIWTAAVPVAVLGTFVVVGWLDLALRVDRLPTLQ